MYIACFPSNMYLIYLVNIPNIAFTCYDQVAQAEAEYEAQLASQKHRIEQEAQENLTVKDRKLQLLRKIMNQSDVESLAGDVARSTPLPQVTLIAHYVDFVLL